MASTPGYQGGGFFKKYRNGYRVPLTNRRRFARVLSSVAAGEDTRAPGRMNLIGSATVHCSGERSKSSSVCKVYESNK